MRFGSFLKIAMLLLAALFATQMMGQSLISGDISGTVSDQSGAVVANATVTLKSLDRGETQTTTTNANGLYRFSLLKPGSYSVLVAQIGFRKTEQKAAVNVGQISSVNFSLELGQASEVVEVTGTAPVVNVENANVSTNFDQKIVQETPNPGGDLTNVAQTAPGVTMNTSAGYGNFTANGLPATSNVFTVNGENNMDPFFNTNNSGATNLTLGLNEIQEATVVTNPYSGQYGQQAGAQVTFLTKSGSNNFHGSARYDWNGRYLNANDWFANNSGTPRPFANTNQWGADFGGPIVKDKTFFYLDAEGLTYVLPTVQNTYVVTPLYANAVLANLATNYPAEVPLYTQLFNVWTNAPGAANGTLQGGSCPTGVSPAGTTLPFTTNDACITNFIATPNSRSHEWILAARVDQNIGDANRLFGRFRADHGVQATYTDPVNSNFDATSTQPSYDGQLNWTRIVSPTTTNQFVMSGNWYSAPFVQDEAKAQATFPFDMTFSGLSLTNFARLRSFPQGRNVTQYQFIDDFTMMKGNHGLKFGANFRRYDVSDHNYFYRYPRLLISNLGEFYDGFAGYTRQDMGPSDVVAPFALYGLGMYAQDEWRVNHKLKLTLALRAERNGNPTCQNNCFSRLADSFFNMTLTGDTPYNQSILANQQHPFKSVDGMNFSPRVGFTWSPFGDDKTVISGGFGIFYDAIAQGMAEGAFQNPPGWVDYRVPNSAWADPDPVNGALGQLQSTAAAFQAGYAAGLSYNQIKALAPDFRAPIMNSYAGQFHTPQYQEWNLQFQRALGNTMSIMMNYYGTHGIHIPIQNGGLDAYDPYGLILNGALPTTKPDPSFNAIQEWYTGASANSNGLDVGFTRRMSHGFSTQMTFTWAHALDDVSNGGAFVYGTDSFVSQLYPFSLTPYNYGNADYDIRKNFTGNVLWQPTYKSSNKPLDVILGGWSFSGTIFARSGLPYSILDTNSVGYFGYGTTYAGYQAMFGYPQGPGATFGQTGNCVNGHSQCFDPAAFIDIATAPGYPGWSPMRRNQYRGPGFIDANFNFMKYFNIKEKARFGLGANFYNVFNHPNFANPNWALADGDPTVGTILSTVGTPASPYGSFVGAAAAPRLIQIEAKISF
jgi:hypothetical protein